MSTLKTSALFVVFLAAACSQGVAGPPATAVANPHPEPAKPDWEKPFVASSNRPFHEQMMETMERMDDGMSRAPMSGDPDHDFATMMIPHHQGGIDMAKVLLVQGKDPELLRLAQAIVTDQQNEIELMQLWLERHAQASAVSQREVAP